MGKPRKIKVVYAKLGRDRAWGYYNDGTVYIDERLKGKKHLEICLHECLHHLFPDASEEEVIRKSVLLTNTLWKEGYRRIDNDNSEELQDGKK
jgi:hypothetical protein